MRHAFTIALLLSVSLPAPARAQEKLVSSGETATPPTQIVLVEADPGELLVFHGDAKAARCVVADSKIACEALGSAAVIAPAVKGQPAPEGAPAGEGAK